MLSFLLATLILGAATAESATRPLDEKTQSQISLEERVAAQTAIEQVYWAHRIWPEQNPEPKPSLDSVLPEVAIRGKVDDYLRKNAALEKYWSHRITTNDLEAEFERILRRTRNPAMLKELIEALGDNRQLILDCLVRPVLVDRLIRNWYASDSRFHGRVESRALNELGTNPTLNRLNATSGQYSEVVWRREDGPDSADGEADRKEIVLPSAEFDRRAELIRASVSVDPSVKQETPIASLRESPQSFYLIAVLDWQQDRVVLGVTSWAKRPFDDWWKATREQLDANLPVLTPADNLRTSVASAAADSGDITCRIDDSWKSIWDVPSHRSSQTAVWTGAEMIVWGGQYSNTGPTNVNTGGRYNPALDVWARTSTGPNVPSARMDHTAVWTGTQMIVWGGRDHQTYLNTGAIYDPTSDTWTTVSTGSDVPTARSDHTAVWAGSEMIVWGGWNVSQHFNSGSRYDPIANQWTATSEIGNVPTPRRRHSAIWTDTEMIIWGGSGTGSFNSGGRYDPSTDEWEPTSILAVPVARSSHSAVWTGSEMIIWGGTSGGGYLSTGGRYDPTNDSWDATSGDGSPVSRIGHTAIWTGDEMIVWGGYRGAYLDSGGRYSPDDDTWTSTSPGANVPSPRTEHSAIWTDTEMIVWGGNYYDGFYSHYYNTGARYNPASDSWLPTAADAAAPLARRYHSAVSTGSEMIVWGGLYDESPEHTDTGGRYDPTLDSWTPTSTDNVPASRYEHTAVWTGTEMIVWSGRNFFPINSGGRYYPMTDSWLSTSTENTPAGRRDHTAVWSGTEMIVWGGRDISRFSTGGRYDPVSDEWQPTSVLPDVPGARYDHTAVWTGSEMIVWGGYGGSRTNTGSRYDPSTDVWHSTSVDPSTPGGRQDHTAVWTGTEMIVWGGVGNGYQNTGGRYDPLTDDWLSTSTGPGVPIARTDHSSVWATSVSEMIVWGGNSGNSLLNTGGRYNPATDSWTASSTGNHCPSPRWDQTAVWIGSEMLVWGGRDVDLLSTGGLYCACVMLDWYADQDGDGFGDPADHKSECLQPVGYVDNPQDCNDDNGAVHPGVQELCDGIDNNCDSEIDVDTGELPDGTTWAITCRRFEQKPKPAGFTPAKPHAGKGAAGGPRPR